MSARTIATNPWTRLALIVLLALGAAAASRAGAEDAEASLLLVAQPKLQGEFYGSTVLIAKPIGHGRHIGFIINRPTQYTLGALFPEHAASKAVADPVFLGGPVNTHLIFALVERSESPGGRSLRLAPDMHVTMDAETIDRIIETDAAHARFVAGLVAWDAGELEDELKRGLWYAQEPRASVVMGKRVEGLWEELKTRSELRHRGI